MIYLIELIITMLVIAFGISVSNGYRDDYLSKDNTNSLKGIAAIFILLHHISQYIELFSGLIFMRYIGFILVSVFFFSSGYGLMYGLNNKKDYLQGFFSRRILPVLSVYWVVNIVTIISYLVVGKKFTAFEYVLSFLGIDTVTASWFVGAIVILYLGFYCSFKLSRHYGYYILFAFIVVYCIFFSFIGYKSSYTASVATFMLGVVWQKIDFDSWIVKRYWLKLAILCTSFLFLFFSRLFLSAKGIEAIWLHIIMRNIICVIYLVLVFAICKKVSFGGKIVRWLGTIAYELYLVQGLWILLLYHSNEVFYTIAVFVGSLISAPLLKWLMHFVKRQDRAHIKN